MCHTDTKFLGVILDHKLTFKSHNDYISNKIAKCIGIISKARRALSTYSLRMLYMALVQPYLFYCVEIWGHTYASYTKNLSILQKRLVHIITFSRYDDHTLPLFKSLKILPFGEQYEYKVPLSFSKVYKMHCHIRLLTISLPIYHQDMLTTCSHHFVLTNYVNFL